MSPDMQQQDHISKRRVVYSVAGAEAATVRRITSRYSADHSVPDSARSTEKQRNCPSTGAMWSDW